MDYLMQVIAPNITPDRLEAAAKRYREVLETSLGNRGQVAICFRAWGRFKDQGQQALTTEENKLSGAWIRAHDAEQLAGRAELEDPTADDVRFFVRIG